MGKKTFPEGPLESSPMKGGSQGRTSREHHKRRSPENTLGDACNEHHEGGPPQRVPRGRTSIERHERETPGEHYSGKTSSEHHGGEVLDKERVV